MRLAGVAHGASADPDALLRQLHEAVRTAASVIRQLSTTERGKRGISTEAEADAVLAPGELMECRTLKPWYRSR